MIDLDQQFLYSVYLQRFLLISGSNFLRTHKKIITKNEIEKSEFLFFNFSSGYIYVSQFFFNHIFLHSLFLLHLYIGIQEIKTTATWYNMIWKINRFRSFKFVYLLYSEIYEKTFFVGLIFPFQLPIQNFQNNKNWKIEIGLDSNILIIEGSLLNVNIWIGGWT